MSEPLRVEPHPLLDLGALEATFPSPLGERPSSGALQALLALDAPAPFSADDEVRARVRDLLRHGGYKPTGRGKPASEYLLRAVGDGALGAINPAVDACNVVSLHSGLPISVVDLERAQAPLHVGLAAADAEYVFNASGQTIRLGGLLCVHDGLGPCANGVKDSQRTKTHPGTTRVLGVVWGTTGLPGRTRAALEWYRDLLAAEGARVSVLLPG
ncbi:MAG: phenylalanine--tRNA ligase beta subunit-related protein [Planctomycetota bacterium]